MQPLTNTKISMDALGVVASSLCLLHCLALPFAIAALPWMGLDFLEGHAAHVWLAALVLAFALSAILPGYLAHRRTEILASMLIGLSLLLFATFLCHPLLGESWEIPLITAANLIIVFTHLGNRSLLRQLGRLQCGKRCTNQ